MFIVFSGFPTVDGDDMNRLLLSRQAVFQLQEIQRAVMEASTWNAIRASDRIWKSADSFQVFISKLSEVLQIQVSEIFTRTSIQEQ